MSTACQQKSLEEMAAGLVSKLYNLSLLCLDSPKRTAEVCAKFRFHSVQYYFQERTLEMLRTNVEADAMYHISDALLIHFLLFTVRGQAYLMGPFCPVVLADREMRLLFENIGLPQELRQEYPAYRSSFPVIPEHEAYRIARTFIQEVAADEPQKAVRPIRYEMKYTDLPPENWSPTENRAAYVMDRYATEKEFIDQICSGKAREALQSLHRLRTDTFYLSRMCLGSTMENYRLGAATIRTEVRTIAVRENLPVLLIDRISGENLRESIRAKTPDEILASEEKMIRAYCRAIRNARSETYSALIQSVLYVLDNDYASEIHLSDIAEELNVSKSFMITAFRKEVGTTPNAYLTKVRMKAAARLLSSGGLSVAGVSSAVGIADANYFVKLFKNEYGQTPSAYRKQRSV